MITHHDNLKPCVLPAKVGIPHCPTSEHTYITVVPGVPIPQGDANGQLQGQFTRPAHLRQNIRPPLRYGEFFTH